MNAERLELEQVRQGNGGILRPTDVVEFARDADTALHTRFEWDDTKAAEQHRLAQARQIIRCVVTVTEKNAPPVRAYVSLLPDRDDGNSYRAVTDVLRDPDLQARMVEEALRSADLWRERYERLNALRPIVDAIKKVRRRSRKKKAS